LLCIFQIEITIRELDGVLYQSLHLARHGLPMLIGDRMANVFTMRSEKPLILFDSDQQKTTNQRVLDMGGVVLNLNSEGQGFVDQPEEMQRNFAEVLPYTSNVCLWGERQREILSALIPGSERQKLVVTGHPSFDLLAPKFVPYYRNPDIVGRHGEDYALINTSFGMFNHEMGFEHYMRMLSRMDEWKVYGSPEHRAHLERRCRHQEKTALALIELARTLAHAHPKRHVIIRPHPAENSRFYSDRLGGLPNVLVTKQGSAREWIASAGVVIHHDCTTGMEAMLMGKPVLQYEPYEGIEGSAALMAGIGVRTTSPDEALAHMQRGATMADDAREALLARISPYLANVEKNAARTIADLAAGHAAGRETWLPEPLGFWDNAKCWRKYLSKLLRARQPGRNGRKVRYALNKFPRLHKSEVEAKLAGLRRIEPELPEVNVKQLCLNTFLIEPARRS
jgi:surface carbohydrate biosynthesis protein